MEGILDFLIMEEIDLIKNFERISSTIPNRILKLQGYLLKGNNKEELEIIIFKGFSSSTTHPIEIDQEKKVIKSDHFFTNFLLYKAPLGSNSDNFIRENNDFFFFLDKKNWI